MEYLLDNTDADPTIKTAKGYNCLDTAIAKHHPEIVDLLLKHPEWRTLMKSVQYENSDVPITPMRRLIISMPEIAYELIDKRFTTVIGDVDQPKNLIKYDYTFIDDHYNICDWRLGKYTSIVHLFIHSYLSRMYSMRTTSNPLIFKYSYFSINMTDERITKLGRS